MRSEPLLHRYADRAALLDALAARVAGALEEALVQRGGATLAVSGGSTPKPLFERLARTPLEWKKVTITLVDERWVDPASDASNEHLVRSLLLQEYAAKARFVGLKTEVGTPEAGIDACEARLQELPMPLDVVILGMGSDGHTASFFPHAKELQDLLQSENRCGALRPPEAPYPRISLTLPTLLQTRLLLLHIEGEEKFGVYRRALEGSDVDAMPVRSVLHQTQTPLEVYYA